MLSSGSKALNSSSSSKRADPRHLAPSSRTQYPEKTVFFMTPQTLVSDINNGVLDPKDIILLVLGPFSTPASRASSSQAYSHFLLYLMSRR